MQTLESAPGEHTEAAQGAWAGHCPTGFSILWFPFTFHSDALCCLGLGNRVEEEREFWIQQSPKYQINPFQSKRRSGLTRDKVIRALCKKERDN